MRTPLAPALVISFMLCAATFPTRSPAQDASRQAAGGVLPSALASPISAVPRRARFDADSATRAYLATLPPDQKRRSDAYFEGGYWLLLWNFLLSSAVFFFLLHFGISARMRDVAERVRFRPLQTWLYWIQFLVLTSLLQLPLALYQNYFREHRYGLSNLTLGAWLGEQLKGFLLLAVLGGVFIVAAYGVLRRSPRRWWVWGSALTVAFLAFTILIAPVVIVPLFNTPKRLSDQRVVQPILRMARANGIQATDVWEVNASKQSKRISANVSGLGSTERITLNDNLLNRATLPEIEAVMGHEMGHYVLNHVYKLLLAFGVLVAIGFALISTLFERLRRRYEARWRIRAVGDVAGLPLLALLFSAYLFVLTPVTNTIIRTNEYEADIFGLNAARQPDGFATIALKLSEYRKLEPTPLEEVVFFDHPSGRTRIYSAMRWKAENLSGP